MPRIKNNKKKGFSLIELLIAVTIIAILTAVGMANYKTASQKARDSRRQSDLEMIRSSVELYRIDEGVYPLEAQVEDCGNSLDGTNNTYMEDIPCDPKEDTSYHYWVDNSAQPKFELGSELETKGNDKCDNLEDDVNGDEKGYCIKNL